MGYLSFDASVKIHQSGRYHSTKSNKIGSGGIYGYVRHIDRADDKKDGHEVKHTNPNIDPDYTLENESYYKDADGCWKQTAHSRDITKAVKRRIDYAVSHGARIYDGGKNDTCIVRPLIVQIDEQNISDHDDWEGDVIECIEEIFGSDNIVAVSFHFDETSPHAHILFVPVHETTAQDGTVKCSVSQTKFFKNPASLTNMHKQLRKALLDRGYDIEQENKPIEEQFAGYEDSTGKWHQQGLTPQQLEEINYRKIKLRTEEVNMNMRDKELESREARLQERERDLLQREYKIRDEEQRSFEREQGLYSQHRSLMDKEQEFVVKSEKAIRSLQEAAEAYRKAIGDPLGNKEKFLAFCDTVKGKDGRSARVFLNYLLNKYNKQQVENRLFLEKWEQAAMDEVHDLTDRIHSSENEFTF